MSSVSHNKMNCRLHRKYLPKIATMAILDPLSDSLENKATRDGYGEALLELGEKNKRIVVLDADLSGSTKTKAFSKKWPDRFFNFGVAEQNMVGHAAGLAMSDYIPFASSFAIFLTGRAWEIVRNSVAYPRVNVKLAGTHAGITLGEDGASHQIIEDIAIMRAIPGMCVLVPSDFNMAKKLIHEAAKWKGPVYIRLGRPKVPAVYDSSETFEIGKAKVLQKGAEVVFCATGIMVHHAFKAAKVLEQQKGIKPTVIDFGTIKPFDKNTLLENTSKAKIVYTFEEHNIIGGLGSAVTEIISENNPVMVKRIGLNDEFGQSGTVNDLIKHYKLNADSLVERLTKEL